MCFINCFIESPPNFSNITSARTIHIILSAIIEAAGTAHESVLSLWASFSFFVAISTDLKDLIYVGIGFIASLTVIGIALLIPPSIPPALFEKRVYFLPSHPISS